MTRDDEHDRWQIEAALGLISGGRWIAALSLLLSAVAGIALLFPSRSAPWFHVLAAAVIVLGLAQCYLALRCAIDAHLFRRLRDHGGQENPLASLDRALQFLGWLPAEKASRPLAARVLGVARLVRWQGVVALVQALLLPLLGWIGTQ